MPTKNTKTKARRTAKAVGSRPLVRPKSGDPIKSYGPFANLTFVEESNGHVTMRDKAGNEKRVFKTLFDKYAVLA